MIQKSVKMIQKLDQMIQKRAKISKNSRNVAKSHNGRIVRFLPILRHLVIGSFSLWVSPNYFFCVTRPVALNKYQNYLINKLMYLTVRHAPPSVV